MAARAYSGKKPKNLKHTLRVFLSYLGRHKKMLAVVAVLVTISAGANLLGTYMIRPVVNGLADGDVHTLLCGVLITALIFGCGALAAYGYTQAMVKAAQQVVFFLIEYSITLENIWLRFLKVFEQTGTHEDHVSFILIEFLQQVAHRRPIRFIDRKEGLRIKTLLVDLSHRRIEGRKALCPGGERRFTF